MSFDKFLLAFLCTGFAIVRAGDDCSDRFAPLCIKHKRAGHCNVQSWARMLRNICQKTCDFCTGEKKCMDVNEVLCRERKRRGECEQPSHFTVNMCKKTCNFCSGNVKIKAERPTCVDSWTECKRIADMGLCPKLGKLKSRCPLSCNGCDARES